MANHAFAFLSSATFCKVPGLTQRPDAPFVAAGVAWDGCVTNRPGARFGPQAIRMASHMLCDATHPHFDTTPLDLLADAGDLALPNTSLVDMRSAFEPQAAALIAKHHMVWLGGDHSITLSLLRAQHRKLGRPLAVLHFDAHCDTWTDHFGEHSGHGTWVAEAVEEGLMHADACVQIGIRSAAERTARNYIPDRGGLLFSARDLRGKDGAEGLAEIIAATHATLTRHGADTPVYLSFDIDCLDPSFAPGTGTPEPGGLTSSQVLTLLEELCVMPLNWVGMDCVEVSPPYDHAELSSNLGASIVWTYLCARIAAGGA